jgi:hypothetical protein
MFDGEPIKQALFGVAVVFSVAVYVLILMRCCE